VYEVIEIQSASDLLVEDERGIIYRVGSTLECQIQASQIRIERIAPIETKIVNLTLEDEDIETALSQFEQLPRTYLTGTLTISDAVDLILPTRSDRFNTITLQPGEIAYAYLISASPSEAINSLGDYFVSGNLIARTVYVQSKKARKATP
jgi:inner membrane protein